MICQKCGHTNNDVAKFCSVCGSEIIQPTVTEQLKSSQLNVNKTATISALFAPISIIATTMLSLLLNLFFNVVITQFGGYSQYNVSNLVVNVVAALFSLGIYVGLYLIFTLRHRKVLPFFLFMLAPGVSVLTTPVSNLLSLITSLSTDMAGYGTANIFITLLFAFVRATVAYFVIRAIFKKLLVAQK